MGLCGLKFGPLHRGALGDTATAKKAFAKLFVAGTVGAYFGFISRNLSLDLQTVSLSSPDWTYTLGVFIRYLYVVLFLAYFFVSHFSLEAESSQIKWPQIWFNMIQCAVAFIAAYFLDVLIRGKVELAHPTLIGVLWANVAIGVICISSLIFFAKSDSSAEPDAKPALNTLRVGALTISIGAAVFAFCATGETCGGLFLILGTQGFLLWVVVEMFKLVNQQIRADRAQKPDDVTFCSHF
jgi:hypothetical protein